MNKEGAHVSKAFALLAQKNLGGKALNSISVYKFEWACSYSWPG